jgi:LacI family transcriptional regulator
MRWRSLRDAAVELHLAARRIGPFPPDVDGGVLAAATFAAQPTSAVIAYNDQLAIGVVRGLLGMGVRVPGDVSVVGFDNILAAELVTPGLTTVAAPLHTEGAEAIRHLLAMVEGAPTHTGQPFVLPTRLVVRGSTGPSSRIPGAPGPGSRDRARQLMATPGPQPIG